MTEMFDILWIDRVFTSECPMIIRNWVLPLTISLLALSLPLLVGQIHRADERFGKRGVGEIFSRTKYVKFYFGSIIIVLISLLIYFLKIPRCVDFGNTTNAIIDHSAEMVVVITASVFLLSVLWVVYALVTIATNTPKMYEAFRDKLHDYFEKESKLYTNKPGNNKELLEADEEIAKNYYLDPIFAIIRTAVLEKDAKLFNHIYEDLTKSVSTYRQEFRRNHAEKRHVQIEYPSSLLNAVNDLAQHCFEDENIYVQQQVSSIVGTLFIYEEQQDDYDVPRSGIHIDTLKLLWGIVIDATNRNRKEYLKLYWSSIFEYTKKMFHAIVVTRSDLLNGHEQYHLINEDLFEQALISNVHFMWVAYLYEKKEYDFLKEILEYYNGHSDVEELNFFLLKNIIENYSSTQLSHIEGSVINSIDNLIGEFHYYTTTSTSEIYKQRMVLSKFISLIVHIYYNKWNSVPIMPREIIVSDIIGNSLLKSSLLSQQFITGTIFDNTKVEKKMSDDEVNTFVMGVQNRNDEGERRFVKDCQISKAHIYYLFRHVKSTLSGNFGLNSFLWINQRQAATGGRNLNFTSDALSELDIDKSRMVYYGLESTLSKEASQISFSYINAINEQVAKTYYSQVNVEKNDVSGDGLRQILDSMLHADNKRYIFFYTTNEQLETLLSFGLEYKYELGFIYYGGTYPIKCVKLLEDENSQTLDNQLWIVSTKDQPVLKFVEIEENAEWKSVHKYAENKLRIKDAIDVRFERMYHYVKIEEKEDNNSNPLVTVSLKSRIEILGLDNPNVSVYKLDNIGEQHEVNDGNQNIINIITNFLKHIGCKFLKLIGLDKLVNK